MFSRKNFAGLFGLVLASGMVAVAQQPQQTTAPDGSRQERMERRTRHREEMGRHREMRGHGAPGRFMRELNLTDAQREQMRAITQRRLEATKSQREELIRLREKRIAGTFSADDENRAKALRQEIQSSMEGARAETEAVLTAQQKARLEQLKAERNAKHEERQAERKARREQRLRERGDSLKKNNFF